MTDTDKPTFFFDLTADKLKEIISSSGQPSFRSKQILDWAFKRLAVSFDDMTDIPSKLRESLNKTIIFNRLTPLIDRLSKDGWTRKILFNLPDNTQIETVLMGYIERRTACISTQAGCGLGCTFCATGQAGLQRNITSGEIVEQVLYIARWLKEKDEKLTNIVYMGMGEPFANYKEVIKSLKCITSEDGFSFGSRRITVSTVGLVPQILSFAEEEFQVNLAISLHAATNELRETMLPINKKYPLEELIPACREYTKKTGRRISFEWALIDNINDTEEQAKLLVKLINGMLCHVNLIPLNPTKGFEGSGSKQERIVKFKDILTKNGIPNTLRVRRGIDINAGCGQLRQENQNTIPSGSNLTY